MTPDWLSHVAEGASALLALVGFVALGIVVWKGAVLRVQQDTIAAYEKRVAQLEADVKESREKLAKLIGIVEEKDRVIDTMTASLLAAGACAIAHDCPNRVLPAGIQKRRK